MRRLVEPAVEDAEEARRAGPSICVARLQQHRRQRRRQRQRVERRDQHGDGDRDGELLVQPSLNAGHEADRDEHRRENERDADDRSGHFLHRLQRRVARRHALLDVMLHRLDDDNRIVDDQADGEHEAEQRQRVDREAEQREHREGADQRDRHGDHRNERRAPVLQEQVDDEDDQEHRLGERDEDLADALGHRQRRVDGIAVLQILRKSRVWRSAIVFFTPAATASAFEPGV